MPRTIHSKQYQAFLERLKSARKRAKLTQAEVALKLNKPQSYVSKSESGERRIDATEVVEFAKIYGVSLEELLLEVDTNN